MKRLPKWWKKSVVYQIYPRSFRDTNGDGIGDLPGVIEKLDYIRELGCDTIWICPFFESSNYDNGYDITDYEKVLADFGTMEDVETLIAEAHARGIHLLIDMVVNHTSCKHPWFFESRKGRENPMGTPNPFREYYIWKPGKNGGAPNNWEAIFGGSAWTQCECDGNNKSDENCECGENNGRGEYYLHIFSPMQPDLNWESSKLRDEIFRMMRWWLDKGIDGFRMDAVCYISKDPSFPDTTDGNIRPCASFGPHFQAFVRELNEKVLSKYENIMTVAEMSESTPERAEIYANEDDSMFSMIFQFQHLDLDGGDSFKWTHRRINLRELKHLMEYWQTNLYGRAWNSLYWSNHDQPRIFSRFGDSEGPLHEKSAKMIAACTHMMQGTPYVFQGEELGMTNVRFESIEEVRDIESLNAWKKFTADGTFSEAEMLDLISLRGRDNARTPMQWDDSQNAGFSTGTPWIKVNPNYTQINAADQLARPDSVFHFYQKLIQLRKTYEIITAGRYESVDLENPDVFAFLRVLPDEKLLVVCNFTNHPASVALPKEFLSENEKGKEILITNGSCTNWKDGKLEAYDAFVVRMFETCGMV